MATWDLVVQFVEALEANFAARANAFPDVFKKQAANVKAVLSPDERLTASVKERILHEIVEQLLAALKDMNLDATAAKCITEPKPKSKVTETVARLCKDVAALLTCVHIASLTALHSGEIPNEHTVLWVDDHPDGNADEVKAAKEIYHIDIVQVTSTKDAMKWLSSHADLRTASPARFRIITDLHRDDEGDGAGESLIAKVRQAGWVKTPILCYTGENVTALDLCSSHSFVLSTPSDDILALYFDSMRKKWPLSAAPQAPAKKASAVKLPEALAASSSSAAERAPSSSSSEKPPARRISESDDDEWVDTQEMAPVPEAAPSKPASKSSSSASASVSAAKKKEKEKEPSAPAPRLPVATESGTLILNDPINDTFAEEQRRFEEEHRQKANAEEAKRRKEQEAEQKRREEATRKKKEEEQKRQEEAARKKKEEEQKARLAEEEARKRTAAEEKRKAEEEAQRREQEERARLEAEKKRQEELARLEAERKKREPRKFSARDFEVLNAPKQVTLGSTGSFGIALLPKSKPTPAEIELVSSSENYEFSVVLRSGKISVDGLVEEEEDGSRSVTFFATKPSLYQVSVKLGAHDVAGSPFDIDIRPGTKQASKKRKAMESNPAPDSPSKKAKLGEAPAAAPKRVPTVLQYEHSDEESDDGGMDRTIVISPPSKAKPNPAKAAAQAAPKQLKVQSDLESPTLIIHEAHKSSNFSKPAPAQRSASKPKMLFEDDDEEEHAARSVSPKKVSAPVRKPTPLVLENEDDEDDEERSREYPDDTTGLLKLDSDDDGYNTGDSQEAKPKKAAAKPPPARKNVVAEDSPTLPTILPPPSKNSKKPSRLVDEEELEPTLLI